MKNKTEYKGLEIEVVIDDSAENPRTSMDHLGKMVLFHKRYTLPNETTLKSETFCSWKGVKDYLVRVEGAKVILPVYMYDHSGITVSTKPFHDAFDSGQVGFIFTSGKTIREEYKVKRVGRRTVAKVQHLLQGEVNMFDQYLRGDIYGYTVKDRDGKEVDSCWGIYGEQEALDDAKFLIDGR